MYMHHFTHASTSSSRGFTECAREREGYIHLNYIFEINSTLKMYKIIKHNRFQLNKVPTKTNLLFRYILTLESLSSSSKILDRELRGTS